MKTYNFSRTAGKELGLDTAYSFRFTETPEFTRKDDAIATAVNPNHREGFDNISLLTPERYTAKVRASLRCSFEDWGCPEIIVVEETERCEDGALRYGPCFEVVLYKDGINVWRHYRDDGVCHWHKRLGAHFPVEEGKLHELTVEIREKEFIIEVDTHLLELRVDDLPKQFHVGLTACEGIVRLYEMTIEEGNEVNEQ